MYYGQLENREFTFRKKKVAKFQGLTHFKWDDLGTQDVIGQGLVWCRILRTKQDSPF